MTLTAMLADRRCLHATPERPINRHLPRREPPMSTYLPNHRDPLTLRFARTVRDTVADPWAYSEGAAEPQFVDVTRSFPHAARVRAAAWRRRARRSAWFWFPLFGLVATIALVWLTR